MNNTELKKFLKLKVDFSNTENFLKNQNNQFLNKYFKLFKQVYFTNKNLYCKKYILMNLFVLNFLKYDDIKNEKFFNCFSYDEKTKQVFFDDDIYLNSNNCIKEFIIFNELNDEFNLFTPFFNTDKWTLKGVYNKQLLKIEKELKKDIFNSYNSYFLDKNKLYQFLNQIEFEIENNL